MKTFNVNKIQNKKILGRASVVKEGIAFFWTASGIELNAKTSELWVEIESDYSDFEVWISVYVDGVQNARLMLNKGENRICLFRLRSEHVVKNVCIYKETQAMGDDAHHKMLVKNFMANGNADSVFMPVKDSSVKIEFIGDSITSGEGIVGAKSHDNWNSAVFGGTKTYAFKLAKMLGADFNVISQSGWGVVTGYDNNVLHAIPKYYEQVCGVMRGANNKALGAVALWDFNSWQPNIIVVNLGTNDQGAFNNPPFVQAGSIKFKMRLDSNGVPEKASAAFFEKGVVEFLKTLRAKNPNAKIIWCYGMMGRLLTENIKAAFATYKKISSDKNTQFILLPEIDYSATAALSHPSEQQQQAVAEFLYKRLSVTGNSNRQQ